MMKKRVLTSVAASAALVGALAMSGCGSSSTTTGGSTSGGSTSGGSTSGGSTSGGTAASIVITTDDGRNVTIDPAQGGTVVIRNNNDGTNNTATVVGTPLNECAGATSDPDGDGVICGPESNVTYAFQSDFGTLGGIAGHGDGQGDLDNNSSTYDGGVLLYDAYTLHDGQLYTTPVAGDDNENRIEEVYIPTNYIKLTDAKKNASVDEQYNAMRSYLANVCNMQCFAAEPDNNPYFINGKTKGSFVATFVMLFTHGEGEATLMPKVHNDAADLEYLAVQFQLDVEQVDGNSSKLRFSTPADTPVDFYGKKQGGSALSVTTSNIDLNSIVHQTVSQNDAFTINMAKYFDKLIAKGDSIGVSDYAKAILVENAQHPWPVKIYGTLHEIKDDGSIERSFVRNPGKLDAELFGLTSAGAWQHTFDNDANKSAVKAEKFNIVYPGGSYNDLED